MGCLWISPGSAQLARDRSYLRMRARERVEMDMYRGTRGEERRGPRFWLASCGAHIGPLSIARPTLLGDALAFHDSQVTFLAIRLPLRIGDFGCCTALMKL